MTENTMDLEKEKRILSVLRKTLAQVVKEVTPADSRLRSPLQPDTVEDVRMCFGLIAAREREIMNLLSRVNHDQPRFADQQKTSATVDFIPRKPAGKSE